MMRHTKLASGMVLLLLILILVAGCGRDRQSAADKSADIAIPSIGRTADPCAVALTPHAPAAPAACLPTLCRHLLHPRDASRGLLALRALGVRARRAVPLGLENPVHKL